MSFILGRYRLHTMEKVETVAFTPNNEICISLAVLPPNLTNMTKITYLQALIDSVMPAE